MIGICTDSNAQLPAELAARLGIEVVPLSVRVDGVEHLEGVDLGADELYARFEREPAPEITTAAPSPGRFAAAYERLAAAGATEVVSIHLGAELSGTCNAARLGAMGAPVPVRLVDSRSASFAIALAVLAACDAAARGATAEDAAAAAEWVVERCGNVFVVGTLAFARAGGRLDPTVGEAAGIPVLRLAGGAMTTAGEARTPSAAAELMADEVLALPGAVRAGVGDSDASSRPVADELAARLAAAGDRIEVIRYRVGPSVAVHTGPGTAGAVFHPLRA